MALTIRMPAYLHSRHKETCNPAFLCALPPEYGISMNLTEGQKRYREYLKSEHWAQLRMKQPKKKCTACHTKKNLDLHHMVYLDDWYKTTSKHLCWLCRRCHSLFHSEFGVTLPSQHPNGLRLQTKRLLRQKLQERKVA